jgi:hypothetical protein
MFLGPDGFSVDGENDRCQNANTGLSWPLYGAQSGLILANGCLYLRGFWAWESDGFTGLVWPEKRDFGGDFYDRERDPE